MKRISISQTEMLLGDFIICDSLYEVLSNHPYCNLTKTIVRLIQMLVWNNMEIFHSWYNFLCDNIMKLLYFFVYSKFLWDIKKIDRVPVILTYSKHVALFCYTILSVTVEALE